MEYIHQGTILFRRGRTIYLDDMNQIFVCPDEKCEYVMTALTEEGILTIRDTHIRILHPELLTTMRFNDSFGGEVIHARFERDDSFGELSGLSMWGPNQRTREPDPMDQMR